LDAALHLCICDVCLYCVSGNRNYKTFKPKKHIAEGSHQFELMKYAMQTLGSGNLRMAVALPEGEDLNEWVAVNSECDLSVAFLAMVLKHHYLLHVRLL